MVRRGGATGRPVGPLGGGALGRGAVVAGPGPWPTGARGRRRGATQADPGKRRGTTVASGAEGAARRGGAALQLKLGIPPASGVTWSLAGL